MGNCKTSFSPCLPTRKHNLQTDIFYDLFSSPISHKDMFVCMNVEFHYVFSCLAI